MYSIIVRIIFGKAVCINKLSVYLRTTYLTFCWKYLIESVLQWICAMVMALSAKNKLGFVNGNVPKPTTSSPASPIGISCNDMVKSWLLNSLSLKISSSVVYCDLAYEIWTKLHEVSFFFGGAYVTIHNLVQTMYVTTICY